MFIDPVKLIDETLENLDMLSGLLAFDFDERTAKSSRLTPEAMKCKEALGAINALVPRLQVTVAKLRDARSAQAAENVPNESRCLNCDD